MNFFKNLLLSCTLVTLVACSLDVDDYSDYCPVATKLIPLEISVVFKCAPDEECFKYPARVEFGRVSRPLGIDCWGGVYSYTFVSGDIREEATNSYVHPIYELRPDSSNRIEFSMIDRYGAEKKYDIKLTDYIPKYKVVGDTLEIDARNGVYYYYKGRKEWGVDSLLKLEINENILPFFDFVYAERMANEDSLTFTGTVYWR